VTQKGKGSVQEKITPRIVKQFAAKQISAGEIARQVGCCVTSVTKALAKHGLKVDPFPGSSVTPEQVAALFRAGHSTKSMAVELKCSLQVVRVRLKQAGIEYDGYEQRQKENDEQRGLADLFTVHTPASAYWAGFLLADGSVDDHRGTLAVTVDCADALHMFDLADFLGVENAPKLKHRRRSGKKGPRSSVEVCLKIGSASLVRNLARWGVVPAKTYRPTSLAPSVARDRHFWRGVFDGDGHLVITDTFGPPNYPHLVLVGAKPHVSQFLNFVKSNGLEHGALSSTPGPRKHLLWRTAFYGPKAVAVAKLLYDELADCPALYRKRIMAERIMNLEKREIATKARIARAQKKKPE
jgi:hypothetical protein